MVPNDSQYTKTWGLEKNQVSRQTWIKYFFDTTVFFEGQNLTQKHRDSRQNVNGNQSKKQSFKGYF